MDTTPGGENTQYESIKTVTNPPKKQDGQFSDSTPTPTPTKPTPSISRQDEIASNMRYGQAMSEQGVGGFTAPDRNGGEADAEQDSGGSGSGAKQTRREQGYDASNDMDRNLGS